MEPMYLKFSTANSDYIYDGISSEVIPSDKVIEKILKYYSSKDKEDIYNQYIFGECSHENYLKKYEDIENRVKMGCFFKKDSLLIQHNLEKDILNVPSSYLILVLTEECNLRCKYCVYSDKYEKASNYSSQKMSYETAVNAVDEYLKVHSERQKHGLFRKPEIGFYGGEPLLNFKLIKRVIEYVKSKKIDCEYYITTNAILLSDEVIDFLLINDFKVTFSLDGNKENHDRNRVFANGNQSFDLVMKKIRRFVNKRKEFNKEDLAFSFSCCFDYLTNLHDLINFFVENYDLFAPFFIIYSQIDPYDTTYYDSINENNIINFQKQLHEIRDKFFGVKELEQKYHEVVSSLFLGIMTIYFRSKWVQAPYFGSCIPLTKMAVYPDGTITMCEKMAKRFPIGNVNNIGIDLESVKKLDSLLFNNYKSGKCSNCSCQLLCQTCYVNLESNGEINNQFCKDQKLFVKSNLTFLYSLLEVNPEIVKRFSLKPEYLGVYEHFQ